MFITGQL